MVTDFTQGCSSDTGAIFNEPEKVTPGGPVEILCSVIENCINNKLNDVQPKCLTDQATWNNLDLTHKIQMVVDRMCQGQPPSITFGTIPATDIRNAPLVIPITVHVDPGKTLASVVALQISGPSALTYTVVPNGSPSVDYYAYNLNVTGFSTSPQAGNYTVRVTAVDSAALSSLVNIPFVLQYTDFSLTADNKTITSPVSSVILSPAVVQGSFPLSYVWQFVSGPLAPTIASPTSRTTNVTGLTAAGSYTLRLTGNEVGGTSSHSVNNVITVQAGTSYNTALGFSTNPSVSAEGVTAQVTGVNNLIKLEFNKVTNPIGLYSNFIISVNSVQTMQVTFRTEYLGLPYRFTSTAGVTHNGVFQTTNVNFTE